MNPDTIQHELDRVHSMTDDQLNTRYTKMTKPEKIEAFYRALVQENRNPSLQGRISKDHLMRRVSSSSPWVLVLPRDGDPQSVDNWTFRAHDEGGIIQVFHNDDAWQDKYANGYYPMAEARTLWNNLIHKGYKPQE